MDHFKKHLIQRVPFSETTRACKGERVDAPPRPSSRSRKRPISAMAVASQRHDFSEWKAEEAKKAPPAEVAEEAL